MFKLSIDLKPSIKRLEIVTKNLVNTKSIGKYRSVFKGRGLEFDSYRNYTQLDDANMIDWKASARSNNLLIKQFIEERDINVFFLIDVSSSMLIGSSEKLKAEYAAELTASIFYAALQAGDKVGFAMFNEKIVKKSLPQQNPSQFYIFSKAIVDTSSYGDGYNLVEALKFVMTALKESSIVIIISDFIGLKGEWERYLRTVSGKFDLIGMTIRDITDYKLPDVKGSVLLEDPFSHRQCLVRPEEVGKKYTNYAKLQEKKLSEAFRKANSDLVIFYTEDDFIKTVTSYFEQRMSKWR